VRHTLFIYFSSIVLLLGVGACSSPQGVQGSNLAYLYNPKELALKANYVVVHQNDSVSQLHYRFNSSDLLYVRNNETGRYEANFNLTYRVLKSSNSVSYSDSNSFSFVDEVSQPPQKVISGYFNFKTDDSQLKDQAGLLVIELQDLKRKVGYQSFKRFSKKSLNQRQYFRLTDTANRLLYEPHLPVGVPFKLAHDVLEPKSFYVSFYERDFPVALPPYSSKKPSTFELKPDTTYKVDANATLNLPQKGFYHIRLDTSQWEGFTLYSFYREFPYIANFENLAPPLRYLTTAKEYAQVEAALANPLEAKKLVDRFWLERAGSQERSKSLIKSYYQRVEEANRLFTSFMEGWKTDRGIIYTIYGPPNIVYHSEGGESWVYGSESSSLSYYFNFEKIANPFTDNDYELNRSPQYRYGWGQAIEAWRNGHIYNSKDIRREQDAQDQQLQYRNRNPYWY